MRLLLKKDIKKRRKKNPVNILRDYFYFYNLKKNAAYVVMVTQG
jgi:hypothetical protein